MTVVTGLVRISVVGGRTQVDLAVPSSMPLASLMPDVLMLLHVDDPPAEAPGTGTACWTLARIGGAVLNPSESLRDSGVHDGEILMLTDDPPGGARPVTDDVVAGVAALISDERPPWTAGSARWTAYAVAVIAACGAAAAGSVAALRGDTSTPLLIASVATAFLLVAALTGDRLGTDPRTSATFSLAACLLAASAGAAVGTTGGSRVAAAGLAAATVAVIGCRGTGSLLAAHTAIATAGLSTAAVGALFAAWAAPVSSIAAVGAALGVTTVMIAGRIAIAAAHLPLPPVPSSPPPIGDPAEERSAVDGVEALGPDRSDPLGAIADIALGDLDSLAARAAAASSYLTGIIAGATLTTVGCTLVAATEPSRAVFAFWAVITLVLAARGRVHSDHTQSATLIGGAAACAIGVPLVQTLLTGDAASAVTAMLAALGVGIVALVAGTVAANREFTPLQVRVAEIGQYLVLALVLPILLWVLDAYRLIREL
ncbi:type VII secretion integral membrane protein EccD [Gordonia sp. PDNC005]|uniref:type VII secretion integral membrane protein EccD n=1 Tax=Gordonia sp. PDNC005 TaxID=2811424 RepID=UPI001964A268|nr:type VII secretion integral membrane protein EccD [Gordonia sp. PDNC005]QRY63377.1 type VII secretion integral membrane protein EccD [Gordonia sp. PDNC005]